MLGTIAAASVISHPLMFFAGRKTVKQNQNRANLILERNRLEDGVLMFTKRACEALTLGLVADALVAGITGTPTSGYLMLLTMISVTNVTMFNLGKLGAIENELESRAGFITPINTL